MMRRHAIARAMAGARWNPRDGLIGSDQGIWLDPSDLSTMYTESGESPATLTPALLNGPVGRILDKSGRGNHAYSPTDFARPILQQDANGCYYLLFNGTITSMQATGAFLSGASRFVSVLGFRINTAKAFNPIFSWGLKGSYTDDVLYFHESGNNKISYQVNNGLEGSATESAATFTQFTNVNSLVFDGTQPTATNRIAVRKNGVVNSLSFNYSPPSSVATNALGKFWIGQYNGDAEYFNGRLYQLIVCGRTTEVPIDQITRTEEFVNRKTKAY